MPADAAAVRRDPAAAPVERGPRRLVRLYGALVRSEVQAASAYRAQLVIGALSWVVPVAFMALWRGAAADGELAGVSSAELTTYYAVIMLTTAVQLSEGLSFGVEPLVHSGELSALLLRPHHAAHPLVARGLARLAFTAAPLLVVVPALAVGLGGTATADPGQWLVAAGMLALGFVSEIHLGLIMGSLALWFTRSAALSGLLFGAEWIAGGLVAPVVLLGSPWSELLRHQPLWFAIGAPAEAVSGISTVSPWLLVEAGAWAVVLHVAFRRLWRRGARRFEAVGT